MSRLGSSVFLSGVVAATCALTSPLIAGMPVEIPATCPIGGEEFTYISAASYSTWGRRPDGKPYGSWSFPVELAVCPSNGLPIYRNFDQGEIATLTDYVLSEDFQSLRGHETSYYRAYQVARALDDVLMVNLLIAASWEAEGSSRREKYLREAIALDGQSVVPKVESIKLGIFAANALRELQDFDGARERIARLRRDLLKENVPGVAAPEQTLAYVDKLAAVVDRRDSSSEPLDMLPGRVAIGYCASGTDLGPAGFCETQNMRDAVSQWRAEQAEREERRRQIWDRSEGEGVARSGPPPPDQNR